MVQDSIKTGADVVTFSGDKILSGPQCGIIIGKKKFIDRIKKNPLARALRCDKLTYAVLEATLKIYLDDEHIAERHPVLKLLTIPLRTLANRARTFRRHLKEPLADKCEILVKDGFSQLGSGSLPARDIPTKLLSFRPVQISSDKFAAALRNYYPPIFTRIEKDEVLFDMRTIAKNEIKFVEKAILDVFSIQKI
jgi:L-seryl-tRNA(Ser) seleniumtransferase